MAEILTARASNVGAWADERGILLLLKNIYSTHFHYIFHSYSVYPHVTQNKPLSTEENRPRKRDPAYCGVTFEIHFSSLSTLILWSPEPNPVSTFSLILLTPDGVGNRKLTLLPKNSFSSMPLPSNSLTPHQWFRNSKLSDTLPSASPLVSLRWLPSSTRKPKWFLSTITFPYYAHNISPELPNQTTFPTM